MQRFFFATFFTAFLSTFSLCASQAQDDIDFESKTPEYGVVKEANREPAAEGKRTWMLHFGGIGIHAPGYVDDRSYNLMPNKIDKMGILVVAPSMGASYSKGKWGASVMYLNKDSFGRPAAIVGGHYNFKDTDHHHLKLHGALYGRHLPLFELSDRRLDYSMRWSKKTGKYEIFPIIFLNPGWRISGPIWFEFATSYIISYVYFSIKF